MAFKVGGVDGSARQNASSKMGAKTGWWNLMEYIMKTCPICGREFVVLKEVEEKAVYCTLECLLVSQRTMKGDKNSSLMSV